MELNGGALSDVVLFRKECWYGRRFVKRLDEGSCMKEEQKESRVVEGIGCGLARCQVGSGLARAAKTG